MTTTGSLVILLGLLLTTNGSEPIVGLRIELRPRPANFKDKVALAEEKHEKERTQKKGKNRFTIGKETTYVTGPLDQDGRIDYPAALNERMRQGVTPENNANVLLWKALGPHPGGTTMPPEYFQWMGIQEPLENGDYFIDLSRYVKEQLKIDSGEGRKEIEDQLNHIIRRPWIPKEYPNLASWLKANEKPLILVVEATKRAHYFSPMVPPKTEKGSSGLLHALVPGVQQCRELAKILAARAMLRAGQGAEDEAWEDLLACHRLRRLVGQGGTLIDGLVGIAIENTANQADLAFLDHTKPNAKHIEKYLGDLRNRPPQPPMADKVDLGERFVFLDIVTMVAIHGIQYLEPPAAGRPKESDPLTDLALAGIDWDPALQNANRWYTRLAAAMREKDRQSREEKLHQMDLELNSLKKQASDRQNLLKALRGGEEPGKALGKAIGDILICLIIPAVRKVHESADRARQEQDNLMLAFALAWYQQDHGHYPKELDALAPKYLGQIPQDLFSGKSLIYRPRENGYLLYSVGVNGKDEEGRGEADDPPGDDLCVRMPVLESRRK